MGKLTALEEVADHRDEVARWQAVLRVDEATHVHV